MLESQAVPLGPCTDLLRITPSEFQCQGNRLEVIRDIRAETELSGITAKAGGTAFSQREVLAQTIVPLLSLHPQSPYLRLHQPGSHCLPHLGDSRRLNPTQLSGPPQLFPVTFPYEWLVCAPASDFPKFSQKSTSGPGEACTPC